MYEWNFVMFPLVIEKDHSIELFYSFFIAKIDENDDLEQQKNTHSRSLPIIFLKESLEGKKCKSEYSLI